MRFDHIVDVLQKQGSALYDLLRCSKIQRLPAALRGLADVARGYFACDLVTANADETDGVQYVNLVDVPTQPGVEINRFHKAPRRRRGRHIVGNALYFEFRTGEQGIGTPHFQLDHRRSTPFVYFY